MYICIYIYICLYFFLVDRRSNASFRSGASGLGDLLPGVVVASQSSKYFSLA